MKRKQGAPVTSSQGSSLNYEALGTITEDKIITFSFCDSFKDRLVDYIQTEYIQKGADLSRLAIVFGGKRPAMFIKRDLAKYFKRSF